MAHNYYPLSPTRLASPALGWLCLITLVSCSATGQSISNLPGDFYQRPGLEAMPRLDYQGMRVINFRDRGATGQADQVVNDLFREAVRDLSASGGGVLYLPAGRYRFNVDLDMENGRRGYAGRFEGIKNVHIVGQGMDTIIEARFFEPDLTRNVMPYLWSFNDSENLSLRDLSFQVFPYFGGRTPRVLEGPFMVAFGGNDRVQMVNCRVDQGRMGITFWGGNRHVWVVDCDVRNTGADGIKFDNCENIVAAYNYIENSNDDAFSGLHFKAGLSRNNAFLYNTLLYNQGWGRGIAISGRDHRVEGNWIESQAMVPIYLHKFHNTTEGFDLYRNGGHVIKGNTIVRGDLHNLPSNALVGHRLNGSIVGLYDYDRVEIIDNQVFGSATHGLLIESGYPTLQVGDLSIEGNRLEGNQRSGLTIATRERDGHIENLKLTDNVIAHNKDTDLRVNGRIERMTVGDNILTQPPAVELAEPTRANGRGFQSAIPGWSLRRVDPTYKDIYAKVRTQPLGDVWMAEARVDPIIEGKLEAVDPTDHGAVADDGRSDTRAFIKAIASLPESGGILRIPAGRFVISPIDGQDHLPHTCIRHHLAVYDRQNVHIVGSEPGQTELVFTSRDHEGIRLVGVEGGSVRDLTLSFTEALPLRFNRSLLDIQAAQNIVVRNVKTRRSAGHAIRVDSSTRILLDGVGVTDANQNGLHILASRQVTVKDCRIDNTRDYAIFVHGIGAIGRMPGFIRIANNTIDGTRSASGIGIGGGDRIVIQGNRISNTYMAGLALVKVNNPFAHENIRASGNRFEKCNQGELSYLPGAVSVLGMLTLDRRQFGQTKLELADNEFVNLPHDAVWVGQSPGLTGLTISGSNLTDVQGEMLRMSDEQRKFTKIRKN